MTKSLEFIFDFASPNAYLVHKALPGLIARTGAVVRYTPCLLGGIFKATGNSAPMVQYADIPAKLAYQRVEIERFIAAHDLTRFAMNPHFPVNSLMVMRAAIVAQADGVFDAYVDAVMAAMWEDGLKMDDPAVAAAALDRSGFDGAAMLARTQDQAVKDVLVTNTQAAVARGVFGIPSFFVGDNLYFGKDRLDQIEATLTR